MPEFVAEADCLTGHLSSTAGQARLPQGAGAGAVRADAGIVGPVDRKMAAVLVEVVQRQAMLDVVPRHRHLPAQKGSGPASMTGLQSHLGGPDALGHADQLVGALRRGRQVTGLGSEVPIRPPGAEVQEVIAEWLADPDGLRGNAPLLDR